MIATTNYGLLKKGTSYKVVREHEDWMLIKTRGQIIYAPKWVFYE